MKAPAMQDMLNHVREARIGFPGAEPEKPGLLLFGPPLRGRTCGSCKLCCTLVPVQLFADVHKPSGERCSFVSHKGCRIYATRPYPCAAWSCRWLFDPDAGDLRRPDQTGYIIDPMPDVVVVNGEQRGVVQVWCDPARPDAHKDPALRAFLAIAADRWGAAAIVRYDSSRGFLLIAPSLNKTGEWWELHTEMKTQAEVDLAIKGASA